MQESKQGIKLVRINKIFGIILLKVELSSYIVKKLNV